MTSPFTQFNANREVQVYPSNELIALALGKNNNCLVQLLRDHMYQQSFFKANHASSDIQRICSRIEQATHKSNTVSSGSMAGVDPKLLWIFTSDI